MYFVGNDTDGITDNEIDFYSSYAWPDFATIPKGTEYFILSVRIVDDGRLEGTEQFHIVPVTAKLPAGEIRLRTKVIIVDNDRKLMCLYLYAIHLSFSLIINMYSKWLA